MGLILNPVAYRIGHVNSWSDSWFLVSAEYVEFLHSSIFLKSFIYYILYKFYPTRFSSWLLSHTEILFFNNNMYIWLYVYEASGKYKITKYIRRLKYGLFRSLRMKTFWLKKRLVDRNPIAISMLNFLRVFGSHIEKYNVVENFVFDAKRRAKLDRLRKRYGKDWLGVEEVEIFRNCLRIFYKSLNPYGLKFLALFLRSFFFLPVKAHNFDQKNLSGLRVFLFFFTYLSYLVKTGVWSYYQSKKLAFNSKIIFVMLRRTVYWLFFRPFINQLSKFLEYLCSFFGISSVFKVSILTNFSLSAFFISRYIITAIKNGFNYMDIVFPIRKTLSNFMTLKIFEPAVIRNAKLKKRLINKTYYSVQDRLAFIINFVFLVKHKLLEKNLYALNTTFNNNNFLKQFSLNHSVINSRNNLKFKLYNSNELNIRTKFIFRRFFTTNNNHCKNIFFNLFSNRLLLESIEADRRAKRKPLTPIQRQKYNENRKVKRLEKMLKIEEQQEGRIIFTYQAYKRWRATTYLRFRKILKNKNKKKLKLNNYVIKNVTIRPNTYLRLFYSIKQNVINNNDTSNLLLLRKLNKICIYVFFVKFFKFIIFSYSKMNYELIYAKFLHRIRFFYLNIAKNYFFNFAKIDLSSIDVYYNFYFLLIFLIIFNNFNKLLYIYSRMLTVNFTLLNVVKRKLIKKNLKQNKKNVSYFKNFINGKITIRKFKQKKEDVNYFKNYIRERLKIKLKPKRRMRKRYYSNFNIDEKLKKRDPLSILKSLVESNDATYVLKKEKREARRRYKKFKIYPSFFFFKKHMKFGKKVPSTFFFDKFAGGNKNIYLNLFKYVKLFLTKNNQYINLLLSNVYSKFIIFPLKKSKSKSKLKKGNFSVKGLIFSFISHIYLIFYLFLLLKVKFSITFKHFKLKYFKIWLNWCFSILSTTKINNVSNKLVSLFVDLITYLKQNILVLSKYSFCLLKSYKLVTDVRQSHFFFIMRYLTFLDNHVVSADYSDSLIRYFFHLIYFISFNFKSIKSFKHILIVRLMQFLDMCWYYWMHYLKKIKKTDKLRRFLNNYKRFLLISTCLLKLLFGKFDSLNEESISLFYAGFKLFFPFYFKYRKRSWDETRSVEDVFYTSFLNEKLNYYANKLSVFNPKKANFNKLAFSAININIFQLFKFFETNYFSLHLSTSNLLSGVFPLKINYYFSYINDLLNSSSNYILNVKFINDKLLSYSNKLVRIKARDNIKSFLYGFKFHFVGRFTRKQQSASMWFRQGFLPTSAMDAQIDYGMFTIPLRYSACTIKIWLYRGTYLPKRTVTFGKWR